MSGVSARNYQARIAQECTDRNAIVVLPTGAGKTFIASLVIMNIMKKDTSKKVVFLVPTCMLVKQQGVALGLHTSLAIGQYSGGEAFPTSYDVLVSTPSAFLAKNLPWEMFSLVVFDEVHHVSKDHPYRKTALRLRSLDTKASPQILGLTASLTYAVRSAKIQEDMRLLASELRIDHMATATNDELRQGGYHANTTSTLIAREDLLGTSQVSSDPNIVPVAQRKTHELLPEFLKRVQADQNTLFTKLLLSVVRAMEAQARERDGGFASPLSEKLANWGAYAKKRATLAPIYAELEHWYEALRFSAASWEEEVELPVLYLRMALNSPGETGSELAQVFASSAGAGIPTVSGDASVRSCVRSFNEYVAANVRFPRLRYLEQTLLERKDGNLRAIVFVQQKITTHILTHFINTNGRLAEANLRATHLYAVDSPATASYKMTRTESKSNMESFRDGAACVLVTTTVAEEGMDVPQANCVIRYDPIQTPVSLVQGRGRARQANSDFIVMRERADRRVASLGAAEVHQQQVVHDFEPNHEADNERLRGVQRAREHGAYDTLMQPFTADTALEVLNIYVSKTKASVDDYPCKNRQGHWVCMLVYTSVLRTVSGQGVDEKSPKMAKRSAAYALLQALRHSVSANT
jgi:ERCC4-related helicase